MIDKIEEQKLHIEMSKQMIDKSKARFRRELARTNDGPKLDIEQLFYFEEQLEVENEENFDAKLMREQNYWDFMMQSECKILSFYKDETSFLTTACLYA